MQRMTSTISRVHVIFSDFAQWFGQKDGEPVQIRRASWLITVLWIIADASLNHARVSLWSSTRPQNVGAPREKITVFPCAERKKKSQKKYRLSSIIESGNVRGFANGVTRREVRAIQTRVGRNPRIRGRREKNNAAIYHGLTRVSRNASRLFSRGWTLLRPMTDNPVDLARCEDCCAQAKQSSVLGRKSWSAASRRHLRFYEWFNGNARRSSSIQPDNAWKIFQHARWCSLASLLEKERRPGRPPILLPFIPFFFLPACVARMFRANSFFSLHRETEHVFCFSLALAPDVARAPSEELRVLLFQFERDALSKEYC